MSKSVRIWLMAAALVAAAGYMVIANANDTATTPDKPACCTEHPETNAAPCPTAAEAAACCKEHEADNTKPCPHHPEKTEHSH